MTKFKLIVWAAVAFGLTVGLLTTGWTLRGWKDGRALAEMTARAEKAETRAEDLTSANLTLEDAVRSCNQAAAAQVAASAAALARRETLDDIMTCPAAPAAVTVSQKGGSLNDAQDKKMVDFWNHDIFAGLGPGVRP